MKSRITQKVNITNTNALLCAITIKSRITQRNNTNALDSDPDRYHIKYTKNTPIYNNHIILIYNESNARWETSIKVISDRWHRGHPKRKSMHTQCDNTQCNFLTTKCVPRRPPPGPPLRHPYYRRDSRNHLRAGHLQMKSTGARPANESQ